MAGAIALVNTVTGIAATTTNTPVFAQQGHATASFLVDVQAVTGTWSVEFDYAISGRTLQIAKLTGINSTGLYFITLNASFPSSGAIPEPNSVIYAVVAVGTLTADTYVVYGD